MPGRAPTAWALLAAVCGCSAELTVPEGALITCQTTADCPAGRICHLGMCVQAAGIDLVAPDLVSTLVAPTVGKVGTAFSISLESSEPLAEPPRVRLGLVPPVEVVCIGAGANRFRCDYTATGLENGGLGGVVSFDVWMKDQGRNETTRKLAGALDLDFAPPGLVVKSVSYLPNPSNPLPQSLIERARTDTAIYVAVSADELLDPAVPPVLAAALGGAVLACDLAPGSRTLTGAGFVCQVPPGAPDGDYLASVSWADPAGNAASVPLSGAPLRVKTSAPTLVVDQGAVVFVRSPWGNAAPEPLGGYTIPAGPYFALEPSDPLSSVGRLPAGAFMLGDGTAPASVTVRLSAEPGALLLGMLRPDSDGTWPRQPLASPDVTGVHVVGIDDAGNESAAVQVTTSEWVATPLPPSLGESPHRFFTIPAVGPARRQVEGPSQEPATSGTDGQAALARAWGTWTESAVPADAPSPRAFSAMAYDSVRGRVVLYGGADYATGLADTWEWDGSRWVNATPPGVSPGIRVAFAMAFDSARGRVVLFGGGSHGEMQDTWEWDGSRWVDVTPAGRSPPARSDHALAYDAARQRVVLFGGIIGGTCLQDTWEWDGSRWTEVTPAGPAPGPRNRHTMAYDDSRGRVVLFGGNDYFGPPLGDIWEWDGTRWTALTTYGATPGPRTLHAMAYDPGRRRLVMMGGWDASYAVRDDVWEWDGSTWADLTPSGARPAPRYIHAMVYDGARGRTLLFGGVDQTGFGYLQDTWQWDGGTWVDVPPSGARPAARGYQAMAFDGARKRVVLFGGYTYEGAVQVFGDTWEWDGHSWRGVVPAGASPSPRFIHAMAFDASRGRVVLFGGMAASYGDLADTWEWDGSTWRNVTPTGASPSARAGHALVYDAERGRIVLFGGNIGNTYLQDTWEWDGSAWTNVTPSGTSPGPRTRHAMAYDGARHRTVLYGGYDDPVRYQDTWEFDGVSWSEAQPSAQTPGWREQHAMAFDGARNRVVLFGGYGAAGYQADTWEWNGSAWIDATPARAGPVGRVLHAMVFDGPRARAVLFGGIGPAGYLGDVWERDAAPSQQPALQFDASSLASGIGASAVTSLRIRTFAGGTYAPGRATDVGATLLGWSNDDAAAGPGAWVALDSNGAGVAAQQPYLGSPSTTRIDWTAASAGEARRFLTERDGQLSFQVRPSGVMGPDPGGAQVALDYIEVRVRYLSP